LNHRIIESLGKLCHDNWTAKTVKIRCKFLGSAADPVQFPAPIVPEVAFLGRSNVGKSSLLNSLAGEKMAHVSSTPGKTRTINFFEIYLRAKSETADLRFVDLPGYGYAKLSKSISAEWPKFINPYLKERTNLNGCVVLVDSNISAQPSDRQLIEFLQAAQRNLLVVATKTDRLSGNQVRNSMNALRRSLEIESILPYSARTGAGRDELWKAIKEITTSPTILG
jgi:GTP-binding protein